MWSSSTHFRLFAASIPAVLALCASGVGETTMEGHGIGAAQAKRASSLRVGHTIRHITVPDSAVPGKSRLVDVHLWYPADNHTDLAAPIELGQALERLVQGQ